MIQQINDESWNALVGKTIANAYQAKANTTDDDGFLILEFTDGTKALVQSSYAYSGQSAGEYSTSIYLEYPFEEEALSASLC